MKVQRLVSKNKVDKAIKNGYVMVNPQPENFIAYGLKNKCQSDCVMFLMEKEVKEEIVGE